MIESQPVVFCNREGSRLFGMYHAPSESRTRDVAVVLLSPGVKARIAPHRLYVRMANDLAERGWPVFRFDFFGLGDSEGELYEKTHSEIHAKIQIGQYVADAQSAMDWLESEQVGRGGFVLAGLCGGAITGLLASTDERVKGLLAFGIPVMLDDPSVNAREFISTGQLNRLRRGYLKRIRDPHAWLRLLSFRSDYRSLIRSLFRRRKSKSNGQGDNPAVSNRNPLFAPAMLQMLEKGIPACCIFGGNDRLYFEFNEQFLGLMGEKLSPISENLTVYSIDGSNHIFAWREWEREAMDVSLDWLQRRFGAEARP